MVGLEQQEDSPVNNFEAVPVPGNVTRESSSGFFHKNRNQAFVDGNVDPSLSPEEKNKKPAFKRDAEGERFFIRDFGID